MAQPPIIRRTEKVREVTSLLREGKTVYLSAFFYSGKTVLLDQLCETWNGETLRFLSGRDDWTEFRRRAGETQEALLVLDGIDAFSANQAAEMAELLTSLTEKQCAVLAGRAQMPSELYSLCAAGSIEKLDWKFMMFDEEETVQLFLEYGLELRPSDVRMIQERLWSWPFGLHILARKMLKGGGASLRGLIEETREDIRRIVLTDVLTAFPESEIIPMRLGMM